MVFPILYATSTFSGGDDDGPRLNKTQKNSFIRGRCYCLESVENVDFLSNGREIHLKVCLPISRVLNCFFECFKNILKTSEEIFLFFGKNSNMTKRFFSLS